MQINFKRPAAIARIKGGKMAAGLSGVVKFHQTHGGILVEANIYGLPNNDNGFYGFHIHNGSACAGEGFSSTGGHYDPVGMPHPRHAGDLPPLLSNGGKAYLQVLTDRFSIPDVIGRTVVIHSQPDDFRSQPAGNAGEKIACGTIRMSR